MKDRFRKAFKKDKRGGKNAADSGSEANRVVESSRHGSQPTQSGGQGGGDVMPFVLRPSAALASVAAASVAAASIGTPGFLPNVQYPADQNPEGGPYSTPTGDSKSSQAPPAPMQIAEIATALEAARAEQKPAVRNVERMGQTLSLPATADSAVDAVGNAVDLWEPLMDKIKIFTGIVTVIGEIHPYAKMVTTILSAVTKPLIAQSERDKNMTSLLQTISRVYDRLGAAKNLKVDEKRRKVAETAVKQSVECAYFIRAYYLQNKTFVLRAVKGVLSSVDQTILGYKTKFEQLSQAFRDLSDIGVETNILRVADMIDSLDMKFDLSNMTHVKGAGVRGDKACLGGTRVDVIDEISEWVNATDVPPVFFLHGEAGTGKSAISHSIGQRFDALGRLGASFCCDRNFAAKRDPETVLTTLSHDLAFVKPAFCRALMESLRANPRLSDTPDIELQWSSLIVAPAQALANPFPVLIIIDAFDECGSQESQSRRTLLSILTERVHELPPNFRILVTSRAEHDVMQALNPASTRHLFHKRMSELPDTKSDILRYINHTMTSQAAYHKKLTEDQLFTLAERSQGYFQWAYLACKVLLGEGKGGLSVRKRFERLLSVSPGKEDLPLDAMYNLILSNTFDSTDKDVMEQYKSVMSQILTAFEPLSQHTLNEIRQKSRHAIEIDEDEIELVVPFLGALFTGVHDRTTPVRPVHASVRDYLLDHKRSRSFFVDLAGGHHTMALGTLRLMADQLEFNMCKLPNSHCKNSEVPDLSKRISDNIPPGLSYACRFWGTHIHGFSSLGGHLSFPVHELHDFIHAKLLFWLEVIAVINKIGVALNTVHLMLQWLKSDLSLRLNNVEDKSRNLVDLLKDTQQFLRIFGRAISDSTPHLYLSALPFVPKGCALQRVFVPDFPGIPEICCNSQCSIQWPAAQAILTGHKDYVISVSVSPDGKHIVSGSYDNTIRIWDAETGKSIGEPLRGHESRVTSVAFSPNGERIVSCSFDKTIRIWDAETGKSIGEPLRGHEYTVTSVAFSPNGERIVSCSEDKTVHIWDAQIPHFLSFCPHRDHHLPERDLWTKQIRLGSDGWLIAPSTQELILWIPPEYRTRLMWPRTQVVISTTPHISLNFQRFAHGPDWAKCYAPRAMSSQGVAL